MNPQVEKVERPGRLTPRRAEAHKGDFGRVLVVGGSADMPGAAALAARSALRGGAGLVTMALPRSARPVAAALCACAISRALCEDGRGYVAAAAAAEVAGALEQCDVAAVGPGLGVSVAARMLVLRALDQARPVVLDADGLNNLAAVVDWPWRRRCPLVLTPHPGEMARLTGRRVVEIQADRENAAIAAAAAWRDRRGGQGAELVLVLKGAHTVVTDGRRCYVNRTGNPGMATGGSGDVLTGLIAALIGQGLSPFEAATAGAWLHGTAGDIAAGELGEASLIAEDIIDRLPAAFKRSAELV